MKGKLFGLVLVLFLVGVLMIGFGDGLKCNGNCWSKEAEKCRCATNMGAGWTNTGKDCSWSCVNDYSLSYCYDGNVYHDISKPSSCKGSETQGCSYDNPVKTLVSECEYGCENGVCKSCVDSSYTPALDTFCGSKTVTTNCDKSVSKIGTLDCGTDASCISNICVPNVQFNYSSWRNINGTVITSAHLGDSVLAIFNGVSIGNTKVVNVTVQKQGT